MLGLSGWVLVVSGDAVRRMMLFRLLEREGHRATVVDDARAALAMLRDEPFDLVLLDISDSQLDAGVLLSGIRADPRLRHVPLLATGVEQCSSQSPLAGSPPDAVLVEAFEDGLLARRVGWCLDRERLSREADHRSPERASTDL